MTHSAPCRVGLSYDNKVKSLAFLLVLSLPMVPASLHRTPKVGDHAAYAMKAIIDLGGKDDVRFTGTFDEKVKAVEGEDVTTTVDSRIQVDVMGVARQGGALSSDRKEKLDGTLVSPARIDSTLLFGVPRIDRLRALYRPKDAVEVGASWWHTEAKNETFKAPPFSSYGKLEGDEKVGARDTWRVSIDANEVEEASPTHVKGMVWIDKADGSLVRGQWTMNGFVYSLTTPPMNARMELVRSDL